MTATLTATDARADVPVAPVEHPELLPPPIPGSRLWGWLWPIAIALVAGVMRLWTIQRPKGIMFDEVYYTADARDLLHHGVEHNRGYLFTVHPPLGKWMIAATEGIFGYVKTNGQRVGHPELGWRVASAIVGTLAVLILARTARRMFRSTLLGCLAGVLLALDGLEFVLSRTGILDIFVMFWLVCALACLVLDRDHGRKRLAARLAEGKTTVDVWRPWRILCGVCLGAMTATKWSGLYHIAAFFCIAIAWDMGARRAAGTRHPILDSLAKDLPVTLFCLLIVPVLAYTASWTGWFLSSNGYDRHVAGSGIIGTLKSWIRYQHQAYSFHVGLDSGHPYMSNQPIGWLTLSRPVSFFYSGIKNGQLGCTSAGGCSREVLAIGTPAIWWTGTLAMLGCVGWWIARRDWRASLIVVGFGFGIVPWFLHADRTKFQFYAAPILPFIVLGLVGMAGLILGRRAAGEERRLTGALIVGGYVLVVLGNFIWLYPILTAKVIPLTAWRARMWFPGWI